MELNPVPVLMITVIYSNIGGAATPGALFLYNR
jgi:Na+/H+ antiporter NhaD/arsenite permease-like protein